MEKLLIWGAGGHARVVADIVRLRGEYEIAGFVHDTPSASAGPIDGAPVIRDREAVMRLRREAHVAHAIVAFGDCAARLDVARWCRGQGFALITAIHPSAVIAASALIGAGTVAAAGAIVNPGAVIGENVILNTAATVDHDCTIGDGAHLSPGVHLGGGVRVGSASWLGVGAAVRDRIVIGCRTVVGVGAVVVSDLPDDVVAYGNPARVRAEARR